VSFDLVPGDGPGGAPEEELDIRPRPAHRRWWWLLAVPLAAAALVWALTRSGAPAGHVPATARTPVVSALPPACRALPHCVVRGAVPATVVRLARTYLPRGARLHVRTVLAAGGPARSRLVQRDIAASVDSVTVLIRVERDGPATRPLAPDPPGVGSLLLHRVNSGFVVRLQYLAPETVPPMVTRLEALLRDPRLTAA
jgi:hypothetical protein